MRVSRHLNKPYRRTRVCRLWSRRLPGGMRMQASPSKVGSMGSGREGRVKVCGVVTARRRRPAGLQPVALGGRGWGGEDEGPWRGHTRLHKHLQTGLRAPEHRSRHPPPPSPNHRFSCPKSWPFTLVCSSRPVLERFCLSPETNSSRSSLTVVPDL